MKLGVINHHLKVFLKFVQFSLMTKMAFRFDFFFGYLIDIGWLVFTLIFFKIFYLNVDSIVGWNYSQILILLGVYWIYQSLLYGLVVIYNLRRLPKRIWTGELDLYLVKPINSQFFVSLKEIWSPIFLNLIPAVWFIYLGLNGLGYQPSLVNLLVFVISALSGILIVYAICFMVVSLAFFVDKVDNLPYLPLAVIDYLVAYPIDIFKGKVKLILTWIIPLAFVCSFPVRILLGQLSLVYGLYSVLLALVFVYLSSLFWQYALRFYFSASS